MAGKKSQSAGKRFQIEIERQAAYHHDLFIVPQNKPTEVFGKGQIRITGKAWPDYIGWIKKDIFLFDAKSTKSENTLTMPKDRKHQFDRLKMVSQRGTLAFYMVLWAPIKEVEVFIVAGDATWPFTIKSGSGIVRAKKENAWLYNLIKELVRCR